MDEIEQTRTIFGDSCPLRHHATQYGNRANINPLLSWLTFQVSGVEATHSEEDREVEDQKSVKTIWQELDIWANGFKPWQRFLLANTVRYGGLTDAQIDQTYAQFLHDNALASAPDPSIEISTQITGRPSLVAPSPIWLIRISDLHAINALLPEAELFFSRGLTVVYGGNGTGKTGFTRILSNVCFSRTQHAILPNVYEKRVDNQPAAVIVIADGMGKETPLSFDSAIEHAELKRIAVFDSAVARTHLVDQSPLCFKPAGFDVFPEMARVYGQINKLLASDTERRTKENTFTKSFVAPESPVSLLVTTLSADTDLTELRRLAVFGETETARLEQIQRQITDLQSKSVEETIRQLEAAKRDVVALKTRLDQSRRLLAEDKRANYRAQLADFVVKTRVVAAQGAESFKQAFFNSIGSLEWNKFLAAAQALAQVEDASYPCDDDYCLLCHRLLDPASVSLIRRFWGFLASDIRSDAEAASANLDESVKLLKTLRLDYFTTDTTAHVHITRLNPGLANQINELVVAMDRDRTAIVTVLENVAGEIASATFGDVTGALTVLDVQIDADIVLLKEQKIEDALKTLEAERITLRHRQVLKQLLPQVEKFVADLVWVRTASGTPLKSLNSRPLTNKENELFTTVIAKEYQERFVKECDLLDCKLPIEFCTQGQRGQTFRSLSIKGGYSPDKILSEGEQRAVALADFLTEIALNPASAGIVLDDPVTSQDHQRKERIAGRLINEAKNRQVIIFTHDLVFLTMLAGTANNERVEILTHWIERDSQGYPGQVSLDDCPATTPQYRNTQKARRTLGEAKTAAGSKRVKLIQRGMGELRRTVEEIVPHFLLKEVVNRWTDRIIVTALKRVNWEDGLIADIIKTYEELSAYIEGHSHTEEQAGTPPEPKHLEEMIVRVEDLIIRARPDKPKSQY